MEVSIPYLLRVLQDPSVPAKRVEEAVQREPMSNPIPPFSDRGYQEQFHVFPLRSKSVRSDIPDERSSHRLQGSVWKSAPANLLEPLEFQTPSHCRENQLFPQCHSQASGIQRQVHSDIHDRNNGSPDTFQNFPKP